MYNILRSSSVICLFCRTSLNIGHAQCAKRQQTIKSALGSFNCLIAIHAVVGRQQIELLLDMRLRLFQ